MISSLLMYYRLKDFFGKYFFFFDRLGTTVKYYFLDGYYNVFKDIGHLRRFITNKYGEFVWSKRYQKDLFDCDDYSLLFKTMCEYYELINGVGVFFDYDTSHAYNIVVTGDGVYVVEPQNLSVMSKEEARKNKLYGLKKGFLLM